MMRLFFLQRLLFGYKPWLSLFMANIATTFVITSESLAKPQSTPIVINDIGAPHPKHCIDERQWRGLEGHTPFQLFDDDPQTVWQPCAYALKEPGYTINIDLSSSIEIDGLELVQAKSLTTPVKRRRQRQSAEPIRHRIETIQVLFFNHDISTKYPIYFQDLIFEGEDSVHIKYDGMLKWNPRLLGDSMFDERRRALKLPPQGVSPPITVDKISIVFPSFDEGKAPPALAELKLFREGRILKTKDLKRSEQSYKDVMSKVYDLMIRDFMLIGESRAMIFSQTGTIWAMEGEEETAKVLGGWRYHRGRIEVDLSSRQRARVQPKRRAKLERARHKYYKPLHVIVDEAPDRVYIIDGPIGGEYQSVKAPSPTTPLSDEKHETAPSFEL